MARISIELSLSCGRRFGAGFLRLWGLSLGSLHRGYRGGSHKFRAFKAHMDECYREQIRDMVVMVEGERGCCDFICDGSYIGTDAGLPEAMGQTYSIPGCAIFTCRNGKIVKIASYYNLKNWIAAVS